MIGISEGISIALDGIFAGKYTIYTESIEQGMEASSFCITPLISSRQDFSSERMREDRSYLLQFFPGDQLNPIKECTEVGDQLLEELNVIETNVCKIRCINKQYEIVDGILNLSMDCNRIIRKKVEEKEIMERMDMTEIYAK